MDVVAFLKEAPVDVVDYAISKGIAHPRYRRLVRMRVSNSNLPGIGRRPTTETVKRPIPHGRPWKRAPEAADPEGMLLGAREASARSRSRSS